MHKGQFASDCTSCRSPIANQLRLVLHTAAYGFMLALRDAIPRAEPFVRTEFATLRLRLLKTGARVVEKATRVRVHFTSACQVASLFRLLAGRLAAADPEATGACPENLSRSLNPKPHRNEPQIPTPQGDAIQRV